MAMFLDISMRRQISKRVEFAAKEPMLPPDFSQGIAGITVDSNPKTLEESMPPPKCVCGVAPAFQVPHIVFPLLLVQDSAHEALPTVDECREAGYQGRFDADPLLPVICSLHLKPFSPPSNHLQVDSQLPVNRELAVKVDTAFGWCVIQARP